MTVCIRLASLRSITCAGTVQDTVETKPGQAYVLSTDSSGRRLIETTNQQVNIQKNDWPLSCQWKPCFEHLEQHLGGGGWSGGASALQDGAIGCLGEGLPLYSSPYFSAAGLPSTDSFPFKLIRQNYGQALSSSL